MKKMVALDLRAGRLTNDTVENVGDAFTPKDKRAAKVLKALKWARNVEAPAVVQVEHEAPPPATAMTTQDFAPAEEPEETPEPADEPEVEAETEVDTDDIDAVREEYERVTGEPADKRYGVARLREEIGKHGDNGGYQRRDMRAED